MRTLCVTALLTSAVFGTTLFLAASPPAPVAMATVAPAGMNAADAADGH